MKVRLDREAAFRLSGLAPGPKRRIKEALASLAKDPSGRMGALDVKQLASPAPLLAYRLKLGDWRVAWYVTDDALEVIRVFHRSEGYGWLQRLYP